MNNKQENRLLQVDDKFQNYIDENFPGLKKYSLLNELIFYGIFGYYYYFGPIQDSTQNFLILKYIIGILVLRFTFNSLTTLTDTNTEKNTSYFQLNSKLAIFIIIILSLSNGHTNTTLAIIMSYTLLTSAISVDTTTVDNIMTSILVLYIYSLNLLVI